MSRPKSLEANRDYIMTQGRAWLESKFKLPVAIDEDAAFIIAQIYTFGEGEDIWLNGRKANDTKLRLVIDTAETSMNNSNAL